ncbi:MAG TPA: (2Fe-2S)-binding protein [Rhizobiaceae bacterium]|jgi:hypothetical protein|nr:(2Fe-2S)-binding protein [Rhizobiaceae bacterium]
MFKALERSSGNLVRIEIDGVELAVPASVSVAGACLLSGMSWLRASPDGSLRGPFCMIATCFECRVTIDGVPGRLACQTRVREGMRVQRLRGDGGSLG